MGETEIKLEVNAAARAGVASAFAGANAVRTRLRAAYWDTPDRRLAERGIALRVRLEGRRWVQTAKAAGDSLLHRLEHNVPIPGRWPADGPVADPARHAGTKVGDLLSAALDGAAAIERRYTTDVMRRSLQVESEGAAVEVVFDEGEVRAGDRRSPVCEVEIESRSGEPALMFEIARAGIAAHGLRIGMLSKAARGERLLDVDVHPVPVKATAAKLAGAMGLDAALRHTVAACLAQVLGNAEAVASGSPDPDHVHQLRVGLRRTRTALRELGSASPALHPAWEPQLARAFRELGVLRDREVLCATVVPRLIEAGAPALPDLPPVTGARPALDIVRDTALQQTLVGLIDYSMGSAERDAPPAKKALSQVLRRLHRRVARDARRFEALPEERQHAVRKLLKRLRYVAEFSRTLFDGKKVARYLERLEPAQDALGRHNDEAVALALYRQAAQAGDPHAWFAVGWLQARQPASAAEGARCLRRIADAPRFFD